MEKRLQRKYIVKTQLGSILCTDGNVYKPIFIGPGTGRSAKIWHIKKFAEMTALRYEGIVQEVDDKGIEVAVVYHGRFNDKTTKREEI